MSPVSYLPTSSSAPAPPPPGLVRRAVLVALPVVRPMAAPALRPLAALVAWPTTAHHQARRNAMVALTECTRRRAQREDVERFLAARVVAEGRTEGGDASGNGGHASSGVTVVSRHA